MRRVLWIVLAGIALALSAGISAAVVAKKEPGTTSAVSASFSATTVSDRKVQTCTGSDGTYEITHARYNGTATSTDPRLNGALEIRVKSVLNTTKGLGWVEGQLRVRNASPKAEAHGSLSAVYQSGQLSGLLKGNVNKPSSKLRANVSAAFSSAGGFTSGQLGAGSSSDSGIVFSAACPGGKPSKP
jgi:hypothetical protein